MYKEAVDAWLPLLKCVLDLFVRNKILLDNTVLFNDGIIFVNGDSDNVTIFSDDMGLVNVYLNNVSLEDVNFDNDDPETIIHVKFMVWCNRYKQHKTCKKEISK